MSNTPSQLNLDLFRKSRITQREISIRCLPYFIDQTRFQFGTK